MLPPTKNFAKVTVSTGYDAADTSVILATGDGARLPAPATAGVFNLVWWNFTDYKDPSDDPNREIIRVIARSTDTLTVVRPAIGNNYNDEGDENTAQTHNIGGKTYKMILAPTKYVLDKIEKGVPIILKGTTTDTTPTEIFIDGGATRITIPANTTRFFDAQIVAGDNTSSKSWHISGGIKRDNVGNTTLAGAIKKQSFGEDDAAAIWDMNVTADDVNEALIFTATGEAAKTIKFRVLVITSDITF